ncbi:MAG: hypothetical protein AUG48_03225 [Actinobacteria bacterium 13_1_20CM_3_68_9]|nr:MAG: hypothetical protein AUG48_03225 [Actinobacteria bacterium 13_1_20CM_3_68_9]
MVAAAEAVNRNWRRDMPTRRALSPHATRAWRIASRSTALSGGGTNSPFEHGPNLIGSPGSSEDTFTPRIRQRGVRRSVQ